LLICYLGRGLQKNYVSAVLDTSYIHGGYQKNYVSAVALENVLSDS
jgi:hypothetical protein